MIWRAATIALGGMFRSATPTTRPAMWYIHKKSTQVHMLPPPAPSPPPPPLHTGLSINLMALFQFRWHLQKVENATPRRDHFEILVAVLAWA